MPRKKTPKVDNSLPMKTFPDLPFDDGPGEQASAPAEKAYSQSDMDAIMKRLEGLESSLKAEKQANIALMAQPLITAKPNLPTEPDFKDLPDPTLDPEKYAAEVAARTQQAWNNKIKLAEYDSQQAAVQTGREQALWETFKDTYSAYAEDEERVRYAAERVAVNAGAKGIDVNKYMFLHSDQFMKDVVSYMDKTFGKPEGDDGAEPETDEADDHRTVGIMGGMDSGGKPVQAAERAPTPAEAFKPITDWQLKYGFHG